MTTDIDTGIWVLPDDQEWHWSVTFDGYTHGLACERTVKAGDDINEIRAFDADDPNVDARCPDCQRVLDGDEPLPTALPSTRYTETTDEQVVVEAEFTQRFAMRFPAPEPEQYGVETVEDAAELFFWGKIDDGDGWDIIDRDRRANYRITSLEADACD